MAKTAQASPPDQIAFVNQLIPEHKRRVALDELLDGYLAEFPRIEQPNNG